MIPRVNTRSRASRFSPGAGLFGIMLQGQLLSALGSAGASCTGAVARVFGAGGFLGAAGAGAAGGRGAAVCALVVAAGDREPCGGAVDPGSGVMMLMGGIEAELGKSALVGLPVAPRGSCCIGVAVVVAARVVAGAFHEAE